VSNQPEDLPKGPNPWKRLTRRVAYENRWLTVFHDEVKRPDGNDGIYGVVHFENRSVGVVALDPSKRVLLVGQFRYTIGRFSWEIPAGGAPVGEDTEATARRELKEETGYSAGSMQLLLHAHMSNSVTDEEGYCYLATDLVAGNASPEGTERIELRWVPFDEALRRIESGEITDALSILALQQTGLRVLR
jgi:8-oxo-dGTP pyrophosphatase MutT (NUDIX family)